jgi:hypothetical protein
MGVTDDDFTRLKRNGFVSFPMTSSGYARFLATQARATEEGMETYEECYHDNGKMLNVVRRVVLERGR